MTKPKTLEQLRAEKERAEIQLAQEQHKLERLENRKKYLEKGERQKLHRRMGDHRSEQAGGVSISDVSAAESIF